MSSRSAIVAVAVVCCVGLLSACSARAQQLQVSIDRPTQDAVVKQREIVAGKVSNPKAHVAVLVHPMAADLWWVQPLPAAINEDGSWEILAHFGTETQGAGEYFEIVALATTATLREGETLTTLPKDAARSRIVRVKRGD